jgi:hypothetical protein
MGNSASTQEWLLARIGREIALDDEPRCGSDCTTTCGNGVLDEGEYCDRFQFLGIRMCEEANLGTGFIACASCDYDLSVCPHWQ